MMASTTRPLFGRNHYRFFSSFSHHTARKASHGAYPLARFEKRYSHSSISTLQAAFKDPLSPFYIRPGETGPASPDAENAGGDGGGGDGSESVEVEKLDSLEDARRKLLDAGFDPGSFWEQRIVWGDQDSFRHVNNARYVRFFESSRITWMSSLGHELGGPSRAKAMITGHGVSLILKSINIQFRRPVTYPDTLLIGFRPKLPSELPATTKKHDPATLYVVASAYSLTQRAFVAHSDEALVWYDYDRLKKCEPGEAAMEVIRKRVHKASQSSTS